ncbi:MAG: MBL fold metallo-hydrolase [Rhizobiales bacterium]|nr:MBL fold metallo-hydrolase [Hyphomicrobiales bacterium]
MNALTRRHVLAGAAAAGAATALTPLLNTPIRAAAPTAGKQVSGWYRYKVGSFEITVVTDGANVNPLADTYVANAPKDKVNDAIAASYLPKDKASQSYTPIVVNTGTKLVAIDTGLGLGLYAQSKGAVGQYHANLAAAGIDRNAIDTVIISHFHGDHINGLLDADNKLAFSKAEVMVPAPEWKYWMDEGNMSKAAGTPLEGNFKNVRRVFGAFGNKVTQYEGGKELVPGIKSLATPGHTPGHTSHIVASGSDQVMVQADVTAAMAFLFVRNPDWHLMFDMDKPLAVQSRRKLYDQMAADKMLVQGFHFRFPGAGYIEKDGNGYRLVPIAWNPVL